MSETGPRNLSFHRYVKEAEQATRPTLAFSTRKRKDFGRWQRAVRKQVLHLLGDLPSRKVPLNVQVLDEKALPEYVRRKILFDVEPNFSIPAYLLVPKGLGNKRAAPALLCLHGHGRGKIDICGIDSDPSILQRFVRPLEYDYAHRYACDGYVVLAPDARGFGELGDLNCSAAYATLTLMGRTVVGLRLWDAMRALDLLVDLPEVNPRRVGCTGLSWGGTHTMYTTLLDPRVKVACISGYFSSIKDTLIDYPQCPCQYIPGLRQYVDFPDLVGAIAPRPLLIQYGDIDPLYTCETVHEEFKKVQIIYAAVGAADRVALDVFHGAHQYHYSTAAAWFKKHL